MPIDIDGVDNPTLSGLVIAFEAFRVSLASRSTNELIPTEEYLAIEQALASAELGPRPFLQGGGILMSFLVADCASSEGSSDRDVWRAVYERLRCRPGDADGAGSCAQVLCDLYSSLNLRNDSDVDRATADVDRILDEPDGFRRLLSGLFGLCSIPYEAFVGSHVKSVARSRAGYEPPLSPTDEMTLEVIAHLYRQVAINRLDERITRLVVAHTRNTPQTVLIGETSRNAMLRELTPLLEHTVRLLDALTRDLDLGPATGSDYLGDQAQCGEEIAIGCLANCALVARYSAYAALDHTRSLVALLSLSGGALGPIVLTRAILEASSRSAWLLDPRLTYHQRVCRSLAYRHASAAWHGEVRNSLGDLDPETPDDVVNRAKAIGIDVRNVRGGLAFDGQQSLNETQVVAWLVERLGYQRPPKLVYAIFSGMAHARPAWLSVFVAGEPPVLVPKPQHRSDILRRCIGLSLTSLMKAFADVFSYYGIGNSEWKLWNALILETTARWPD